MNSVIEIAEGSFWKRLKLAGFVFFLVKGLLWLLVPVAMYLMGTTGQ